MQLAQIEHVFGYTTVPLIELDGQYVAMIRNDMLVIKELSVPVGPGSDASISSHVTATPVLAIRFKHLGSINAIRKWLDRLYDNLSPKWQYKDGD